MEQAFIKIKLLVNDAKDIEKYLKEIDGKTKQAGNNIAKSDSWSKAGNFIAKGFAGSYFFKSAIDAMQKSVSTTNEAMASTDEAIIGRRSYANLFGTQDMTQATVLQNLLESTGAKNPYMLAQNFMAKLGEARTGGEGADMILKDYTGMSNDEALITLLKDLQAENGFSAEERAKILSNVFGNVYGDNVGRLLGKQNISDLEKDIKNTVETIAQSSGFESSTQMFQNQDDTAMSRQRALTKQKLQQDLKVANKVSNEDYTKARLNEVQNTNIRDLNRIDAYTQAQEVNDIVQKASSVKEGLQQGALAVTANMAQAFTDFSGFWKMLKDDWNNNIVPNMKSGFGTLDNDDRVGKR